jgi:hypothetical protein
VDLSFSDLLPAAKPNLRHVLPLTFLPVARQNRWNTDAAESSGNSRTPKSGRGLLPSLIFGKSFAPFLLAAGYNQ